MNAKCKYREDAMMCNETPAEGFGRARRIALAAAAALTLLGANLARAADEQTFPSPEAAAEALDSAWASGKTDALLAIFGPDGARLVSSGDPVAEKDARDRLAAAYAEAHRIEPDGKARMIIVLGKNAWPYPIPLVQQDGAWRFDVAAGAEQIIDRRIGHDERTAIRVCRTYVEAQREYAAKDRQGDGLHEFAQKVASTDGRHDGLYWPATQAGDESPLGPLVATAEAQGYGAPAAGVHRPFHGYYYLILTRQGKSASGGARNYIVNGHMTRGFGLVAFPATYGDSGVMTFVVNQNGIVFEKNLGPDTDAIARQMREYDPDRTWKVAQP